MHFDSLFDRVVIVGLVVVGIVRSVHLILRFLNWCLAPFNEPEVKATCVRMNKNDYLSHSKVSYPDNGISANEKDPL